jgi:protein-arginine kinase activator protein McsA
VSLTVHKKLTCDVCGTTLIEHTQIGRTDFSLEPRNRVELGYNVDLCEECAKPFKEVLDALRAKT